MTTFYLIRHAACDGLGHTLWGRTPGVCLNEEGCTQARRLAEELSEVGFQAIYSSPLERARETAEAIGRMAKLEVQLNDAFNEIDFGDWTGKSFDMLASDERWRQFNTQRSITRIPNGEWFTEVQARAIGQLEILAQRHGEARIAIVSHADVIKSVLGYFAGTPIDSIHEIEIEPCSITVIQSVLE